MLFETHLKQILPAFVVFIAFGMTERSHIDYIRKKQILEENLFILFQSLGSDLC